MRAVQSLGLLGLCLPALVAGPAAGRELPPPAVRPAFDRTAEAVSLEGPARHLRGTGALLAPPDAALIDGLVRARFEGAEVQASLLARARLRAGDRRVEQAVGVRLAGRYAWPVVIERGRARRVGLKVLVLREPARKATEVVLTLAGPWLVADLFDADSGALLASVVARGVPAGPGRVAVRAEAPAGARLLLLSGRQACLRMPDPLGDGPPLVVELEPREARAAAGLALELERLPAEPGRAPERVVLRTDASGLERLTCAGLRPLRVTNDLPWKYLDLDYFHARGRPLPRTAGGLDLGASLKSPDMVREALESWHREHPARTRLEVLGRTWQGRPLLALAIGADLQPDDPRPALLLLGAHHGDEPMAAEAVLDAAQQLLERSDDDPELRRILQEMVVWCLPLVNPDGLQAFMESSVRTGRKNGRDLDLDGRRGPGEGVDLNRNYPFRWDARASPGHRRVTPPRSRYYPGPGPASEPETQAVMRLAERERFLAAISFHTGTVALLAPYTIPEAANPEPNEAWQVAEEVLAGLGRHPTTGQVFRVRRNLYPVHGVDQDWLRHTHGTLALLVEAGGWPPPLAPAERTAELAVLRPLWLDLARRYLEGPSLTGRVLDPDGRPLAAEVRLTGQALRSGERWTTRPRDGRFDRYLPAPGRHTLRVEAAGFTAVERTLEVGSARAVAGEIVLRRAP
ncbi:MAG TPA: M14 family zinc carboxypeptidase [Myxococcota bacterium]|nr:M14 family zinc carboxypeptidase [Myxococcota bacterium]HRY95497.1 M14 family zinc carboxypeptidase [Myxococcota bacterium]